jgi:formylglycine-generating enzyme required for sulfatase activity/CRP-like cAMP-binding protein/chromosome segregation ATPase
MGAAIKQADKKNLQELVPLNALSETRFAEISKKIVIEEVRKGRYLFRKGDRDNQSIYLLDGKINLIDGHRKVTSEVEAGTDISRYPVANQQPRPLSARAATKVVIARVDSGLLDVFLTWDQSSGAEVTEIWAGDDEDWMTRILQSEAFIKIPPAIIQRLLMKMQSFPLHAGKTVIAQGDEGDYFYTIHQGRCAVTRKDTADGEIIKLAELSEGDCFGEEALVSDARRNASVTMLTDGVLMRLAKKDFVELFQEHLINTVSFEKAAGMVDTGAVWLDVRSAGEYEVSAFEDSVNIPLSGLRAEIPELVFNVTYVICCDTGRRSFSAAFLLSHKGFEVYVLDGGLNGLAPDVNTQANLPEEIQDAGYEDANIIDINSNHKAAATGLTAANKSVNSEGGVVEDSAHTVEENGGSGQHTGEQLKELEVLRLENAGLRKEVSAHQESERDLEIRLSELEQLEVEVRDSKAQLSSMQKKVESEAEEEQLLRDQYAALQEEYEHRVKQFELDLGRLKVQCENLQAENETGEQEKQQLQGQLESEQQTRQKELECPEGELRHFRQQAESLQAELAAVNEQAEQYRSDSEAALHEQHQLLEPLRGELNRSHQEIEALQAEVSSARDERQAADEQADIAQRAQNTELDKLREELEHSGKQKEDLQAELDRVQQGHDELGIKLDDESSRARELEQKIEELAARFESGQAEDQNQVEQLRQETEAANASKQNLERQLQSLQQVHQDSLEQLTASTAENEAVTATLKQLQQEYASLRAEHQQSAVQGSEQAEQIENTAADRKAAEDALERLQNEWDSERNRLNEEIDGNRKQVDDLFSQLDQSQEALEREKTRLEQELQSLEEKHNEQLELQASSYQELKQDQSQLSEKSQAVFEERDRLHQDLNAADQDKAAQQQEIEQLNTRIAALTSAADKEVQAVNDQLEAEQKHASAARQEVTEQASQIESLREQLAQQEEERLGLEKEKETLQQKQEEMQQQVQQVEAHFSALDLENQESLKKTYDDLTRKNDTEKEMQGQIERLRKKLEQSAEDLQEARNEARESAELFREELNSERRARTDERAQLAARQRELKEQLAAVANEHEEVISTREGTLAQAKVDAREEEHARLQQALAEQVQSEETIASLQVELNRAHEEIAQAVQQERSCSEADLVLAREQKEEADKAIVRFESQLEQLTQERDTALDEHQAVREQLNTLRAEVDVARGLMGAGGNGRVEDPVKLRAELEEIKKNVEIAVRLRSEAEVQRDRAVEERDELHRQIEEGGVTDTRLHIPSLDEADYSGEQPVDSPAPAGTGRFGIPSGNTESRPAEFKYIKNPGGGSWQGWLGKAAGLGVIGVSALVLMFMLRTENPLIFEEEQVLAGESVPEPTEAGLQEELAVPVEKLSAYNPVLPVPDPPVEDLSRQETQGVNDDRISEIPDTPAVSAVQSFRDTLQDGSQGPWMVELPDVHYMMGSVGSSMNFDERPQHRVDLAAYSIGKYEVTFAEYDRFARATGRRLPYNEGWGRGNRPVINVSWKDARAYASWLSKQTGYKYRLPSEAEWEFAARAGSNDAHWWDTRADTVQANCFDCGSQWDGTRTAVVGSFPANGLDLHDTAGNVQEWTEDCYHSNYNDAAADGSAWQIPRCTQQVVRGGSYTSPIDSLRSARRGQYDHDTRLDNLGFRIVREK